MQDRQGRTRRLDSTYNLRQLWIRTHADAAAWKRWKTMFEAYATISKLSERSEEERAATIVAISGMEAIDLYHSLPFVNARQKANVSKVVEYLEEYFVGEEK